MPSSSSRPEATTVWWDMVCSGGRLRARWVVVSLDWWVVMCSAVQWIQVWRSSVQTSAVQYTAVQYGTRG